MHKSITFLTKSSYVGSWNSPLNAMEGFGTYVFPDGSEYRGYFKAGHFDGYGSMKLLHPQKFYIKAFFEEGICKYIQELRFGDGLKFHGSVDNEGNMYTDSWRYCTAHDRRYYDEIRFGIEPFGPFPRVTAHKAKSKMPKDSYDTSEGFYHPQTGFLSVIEDTGATNNVRFISCPQNREWILKHCRYMPKDNQPVPEPTGEEAFDIIATNMSANDHSDVASCSCKASVERDRYFGNLCQQPWNKDDQSADIEEDSNALHLSYSSSSVESFDYDALKMPAEEETERQPCSWHAKAEDKKKSSDEVLAHAMKTKIMKYVN